MDTWLLCFWTCSEAEHHGGACNRRAEVLACSIQEAESELTCVAEGIPQALGSCTSAHAFIICSKGPRPCLSTLQPCIHIQLVKWSPKTPPLNTREKAYKTVSRRSLKFKPASHGNTISVLETEAGGSWATCWEPISKFKTGCKWISLWAANLQKKWHGNLLLIMKAQP